MTLSIFHFLTEFTEQKALYNEITYGKRSNDINKGYSIFQNFYAGFFFTLSNTPVNLIQNL